MNAYAAMPGRKPSQNSGSHAVPRPLRNAQAAASTSAGIKKRSSELESATARTTQSRAARMAQRFRARPIQSRFWRVLAHHSRQSTTLAASGFARNLAVFSAWHANRASRWLVVKSYCGSFRIRLTRCKNTVSPMPGSTYARNAAAQAIQPSTNSTAPRGILQIVGSLPRRPSNTMPIKITAAASALCGNARKLKQAHTAPSTTSHGRRKPWV